MKNLIRLSDYTMQEVYEIFKLAEVIEQGEYKEFLKDKTVIMFFPEASIRTRVTFEKGVHLLGGQTILFPPTSLDKKEAIEDVIGYLNNWADLVVVRHKSIELIETMAQYANYPVINGMTDVNHPCEILADLYALSKMKKNIHENQILFVGGKGNIGLTWKF